MSRYRFRLATVLLVRRAEEEGARHVLRTANVALHTAVARRDLANRRYRSFAERGRKVCSAEELGAERLHAGFLADDAASAQRAAIALASYAALARVKWSKAARRVAILERLDERRRAEHALAEQRAETALVDDIVTGRYLADVATAEDEP
ncbi:MAG: flagellar export protein FliJ [Acidimicrobiales bacterium]